VTAAVQDALGVAVAARIPTLLWGGPGTGKSSMVRALCERADVPCEIVIASIREPSDFAGLPVVDAMSGTVRFAPPRWAERLAVAGRGLLFLDEITTAPPAVQAALLRVVLERTVGDLVLPPDVVVVAAGNPIDQAADGWDLAAPLANRFCHLDWEVDGRTWAAGVLGGFPTTVVPQLDPVELAEAALAARALVGAFVTARPALLLAVPRQEDAAGRAWPSPRTWELAATAIAAARCARAGDEVEAILVAGCVGPAAALELTGWRADLSLPDPEAILADPMAFRLPERVDRAHAALSALTAAVLARNTPERWAAAWTALGAAARDGAPDIAVATVRALVQHRPDGASPPSEALRAMTPVLRQAGMLDRLLAAG
jgi:MoxR-like ATPase